MKGREVIDGFWNLAVWLLPSSMNAGKSVKEIFDEKTRSDAHDLCIHSGVLRHSRECPAKFRYADDAEAGPNAAAAR